ncbi:MAG: GIY-YIG nuclease family protein [Bacteroidota bacterium]
MNFFCYILFSEKTNKYYVGSCADMVARLQQHNSGRNTSTKSGIPWKVVYTEAFDSNTEARKREAEIKKKKSRKYIEWLISSLN